MRIALKLYFKYTPLWYFIYQLIQIIIYTLLSLCYSILMPATVAAFFAGSIGFYRVAVIFTVLLLFNCIVLIINKVIGYYINPKLNYIYNNGINMLLFRKMNRVSLQYYDNSEFFDKYNLAKEKTLSTVVSSAGWILNIVGQAVSIGTLLTTIALLDPAILLFMVGCVIVSVIIQIIAVIITLRLEKESVNINHIFEYVSRTFYLKRYAVDQRYTNISDVNIHLYLNTIDRMKGIISKYIKRAMPLDCLETGVTDIILYFGILIFSCYRIAILKLYFAGELVALLTSSVALFCKLSDMGGVITQLVDIKKNMEFYTDFMAYTEDHSSINQEIKESLTKEINLHDLSFSYGDTPVLSNISLNIPVSSTLAILGPNGAGKSTLVKILLGLYSEYSGSVTFDGIESTDLNEQSFNNLFMVVNQVPVIYEMSIAENILFRTCETDEDINAVWDVLQKVGLKNKIMQYKDGIDTVIGNEFHTDGVQLSGGEIQKIAIARCLINKKKILIMDEPSSHLDPLSERMLFDLFSTLKDELTFIVVTHNIHNVIHADKIVWMEDGHIEEVGTHEQLINLGKKYATAYNSLYNTLK